VYIIGIKIRKELIPDACLHELSKSKKIMSLKTTINIPKINIPAAINKDVFSKIAVLTESFSKFSRATGDQKVVNPA